jgi:hypothetical protein
VFEYVPTKQRYAMNQLKNFKKQNSEREFLILPS